MRAYNLVTSGPELVAALQKRKKHEMDFLFPNCITARKLKIGDTVFVHNLHFKHTIAVRIVQSKKKIKNEDGTNVLRICFFHNVGFESFQHRLVKNYIVEA